MKLTRNSEKSTHIPDKIIIENLRQLIVFNNSILQQEIITNHQSNKVQFVVYVWKGDKLILIASDRAQY